MNHTDHMALIRNAIKKTDGVWADLGSGAGAFTLALADITKSKTEIYSVDKDKWSLESQRKTFKQMFPDANVHYVIADFTKDLELPLLDGILMANSLHYVKKQISFLSNLRKYFKPNGKLVVVEYNTDSGNIWVPYPLSVHTFEKLASDSGFKNPHIVSKTPSSFLNEMYSASADK